MAINCSLLDLRAFLQVAEHGSFIRAAEALHLSQPALSRRIQKLEEIMGAALLERTTRHVSVTALGLELIPLIRNMIDEFDASLFAVRDVGQRRQSTISIACLPTAAFYFLPAVIRQFNEEFPNIRFRILDLTAVEGLQAVSRGEVDFGINMLGTSDPELIYERLTDDPFILVVRRDHPLAEKDEVSWSEIAAYRLITVHRTSGNRMLLDMSLAKMNLKLQWFYEVAHLSTSLGLVEAGLGVSVLPKMAMPEGKHPFLVVRPIRNPEVTRSIGILRRRGGILSPAARHFLDMLTGMWRETAG